MDKAKSSGKSPDEVQEQKQGCLVSKLLAQISSSNNSCTYKALVEIRTKILKQGHGLSRLRQGGGAKILLDVLEKPEQKWHDVCLSILGNCCLDEHFRAEILQRDGVSLIGVMLQDTKSVSIQNRACRTLGNIALDPHGCREVHRIEGLLETIINILKESNDPECQQTFIRTIRLLSDTENHRVAVLDLRGLKTVADLLVSDTDAVSRASLKVIDHFINQQPTAQCALQLDLASVPKHIVAAVNSKSPGSIQYYNSLIHTMMKHECFRPGLGNSGAIQYFIERIVDCQLPIKQQYVTINSLCLSCKESLNRVRIRDHAGLELLINVLTNDSLHQIHNRVISALLCFLYDEPSINIMLKNNIVNVFMKHLTLCPGWEVTESLSSKFSTALERYIDEVLLVKSSLATDDCTKGEDSTIMDDCSNSASVMKDKTLTSEKGFCKQRQHGPVKREQLEAGKGVKCSRSQSGDLNESADGEKNCSRGENVDVKYPRYSMDSPTYKEISQSVDDKAYNTSGPRSIYECHAYSEASSPLTDCWSSSSSIQCLSPCSQSSYSPISNVSGYYSPDCSPKSSVSDQLPTSPVLFDLTDSPPSCSSHVYSPIQMVSYSSPSKNSSSSSLCESRTGSHNSLVALEYSSSEEDGNDHDDDAESGHQFLQLHTVSNDPKKATITNILMFLSRVSFMENPSRYLLKWCVLDGLIGFLMRNQHKKDDVWNRAYRILIRIFQTPYLDVVVTNTVPLLISLMSEECVANWLKQKSPDTFDTVSDEASHTEMPLDGGKKGHSETVGADLLSILSIEAQNLYGRGVIVHALVTGPATERVKTYLTLPFLYNDPEDLRSMMSYLPSGLDVIAHLLCSKDDILLSSAVAFLRNLLKTFRKRLPDAHSEWHAKDSLLQQADNKRKRDVEEGAQQSRKLAKHQKEDIDSVEKPPDDQTVKTHHVDNDRTEGYVKLRCSDGNSVEVSRDILSAASDVFNTMLSGAFSEAQQSSVIISDFNSATLSLFIDYLHGKDLKATDMSVTNQLDLLRLADQYLIHSLHTDTCECLINWLDESLGSRYERLQSANQCVKELSAVLRASLLYSCHWFGHMCLAKVLCSADAVLSFHIQKEVIKGAIELDNGDVYTNVVSDIILVIKQLLV